MTTESGTGGGISVWVWVLIGGAVVIALIFGIVLFSGGEEEAATTTTTTTEATTTTEESTTTTTEESTTSTIEESTTTTTTIEETTTTTEPPVVAVPETPVKGVLEGDLALPGPVEAHWYQYNNLYVVLYRGYDASTGDPMCPGNSIGVDGTIEALTNSPYNGDPPICNEENIAPEPLGVYACDTLLYYMTGIPTDREGSLFGTLALWDGSSWSSQSTWPEGNQTDIANTPEFIPDQAAYQLPATGVDAGGLVTCGS